MSKKPSQLTVDIREGIKMGLDNEAIAQLCECSTIQVSKVRSRDKHRIKERARKKQRVYSARHREKIKAEREANAGALQGFNIELVQKQKPSISMESTGKYTLWERVKILCRGWA